MKIDVEEIRRACPFFKNGKIIFPLRPLKDYVIIWPYLPNTLLSDKIEIPDQLLEYYNEKGVGVVLGVGPGWHGRDPKYWCLGRWVDPGPREYWHPTDEGLAPGVVVKYDPYVPWRVTVKDSDNKPHELVLCTTCDVHWIFEEE